MNIVEETFKELEKSQHNTFKCMTCKQTNILEDAKKYKFIICGFCYEEFMIVNIDPLKLEYSNAYLGG